MVCAGDVRPPNPHGEACGLQLLSGQETGGRHGFLAKRRLFCKQIIGFFKGTFCFKPETMLFFYLNQVWYWDDLLFGKRTWVEEKHL
jgi:hypothetical protein